MASPIDKLELLRAAGKPGRVPLRTLADLAEYVGVRRDDPELSADLVPLDSPEHQRTFSRIDALSGGSWSPVHLEWPFGELQEFDEDWSGSTLTQFKMRFKSRLMKAGAPSSHAALVCGALDEMISNAQEHADAPCRALATFEVTERWWIFSVTDFGQGIPNRLRQNPDHAALNDMNAICEALRHGVSTYRDEKRGLGFTQVFRVLTDRNAKVRIRAGRGLVDWTGEVRKLQPQPKPMRSGTHVRAGAKLRHPEHPLASFRM